MWNSRRVGKTAAIVLTVLAALSAVVLLAIYARRERSPRPHPDEDAAAFLERMLHAGDSRVRVFAAAVLAGRDDKAGVRLLLERAHSEHLIHRDEVAHVLRLLRGETFAQLASLLLNDAEPQVRIAAARALAVPPKVLAGKLLQQRLKVEKDEFARDAICESLSIRRDKIDAEVLRRVLRSSVSAGEIASARKHLALSGDGPSAAWATQAFEQGSSWQRYVAAEVLVRTGDRSCLSDMIEQAKVGERHERVRALNVLGYCLDDKQAWETVFYALYDESYGIRLAAARVLIRSRTKQAYGVLRRFIEDHPGRIETEFILAEAPVEKLGFPAAALEKLYREGRPVTRVLAAGEILRRR